MPVELASDSVRTPGRTGTQHAALIFNPAAGGGRLRKQIHHLDEAQHILSRAGIETTLLTTGEPGDATDFARQCVADGYELVIASGGDGTVNEVVNGLAGSKVPMAVFPSGTANVLAKELRVPWDVRRAAELVPRSRPRRIALGMISHLDSATADRYFLCLGGAGPDGILVYSVDLNTKLRAGILAYWMEGMRQLIRYKFPHFRITSGDRELMASLVVVGRTRSYGGPFEITTGASLFEDSFEILAVTARNPFTFVGLMPSLWLGRLRRRSDVHFWKTAALRCEPVAANGTAPLPVYAQVDGEPAGRLGVEFRIVPSALTLMVPENSKPGGG
ncbi:MAG TPA: diacylglycerol kinase family protein [Candidatus Acidoferrales bacterium]|nr:diacylglycerol kinase family protein [Candidatus Acidoferrales bacterium]